MFWSAAGGGVRRYLLKKQAWLHRCHWPHTIVAPGAEGSGFRNCGGMPLPFSGGYRLPLSRSQAARLITRQRPDIIEVGDPYRLAWAALDAGQQCGVPTVAFCHSNLAALASRLTGGRGVSARLARQLTESYLRHLYGHFDLVLAPSQSMADELRGLGIAKVECQPLGVDSQIFHPRQRDPVWRESLGLPPDSRVLLYAGRFAPEKNLPVLVSAIQQLGPNYVLLAIGQGPTPPEGEQVIVLPYEACDYKLARIYASVDGFVHAGDQETFGLAALEAMACGTPLVARAAGGLGELLTEGAGIAVPSLAPEAWADAIAEIFTEGGETRFAAARSLAERLDWQCVFPHLLARYEQLLDTHPRLKREMPQRADLLSAQS